jgi:hypothetical protein
MTCQLWCTGGSGCPGLAFEAAQCFPNVKHWSLKANEAQRRKRLTTQYPVLASVPRCTLAADPHRNISNFFFWRRRNRSNTSSDDRIRTPDGHRKSRSASVSRLSMAFPLNPRLSFVFSLFMRVGTQQRPTSRSIDKRTLCDTLTYHTDLCVDPLPPQRMHHPLATIT